MIDVCVERKFSVGSIADYPDDPLTMPRPGLNVVCQHNFYASSKAEAMYALHTSLRRASNIRFTNLSIDGMSVSQTMLERFAVAYANYKHEGHHEL